MRGRDGRGRCTRSGKCPRMAALAQLAHNRCGAVPQTRTLHACERAMKENQLETSGHRKYCTHVAMISGRGMRAGAAASAQCGAARQQWLWHMPRGRSSSTCMYRTVGARIDHCHGARRSHGGVTSGPRLMDLEVHEIGRDSAILAHVAPFVTDPVRALDGAVRKDAIGHLCPL